MAFGAEDNNGKLDSLFVKSLVEMPYNISVLQISQVLIHMDSLLISSSVSNYIRSAFNSLTW